MPEISEVKLAAYQALETAIRNKVKDMPVFEVQLALDVLDYIGKEGLTFDNRG